MAINAMSTLLMNCERSGVAPNYDVTSGKPVELSSSGGEIFLISDLHVGAGIQASGVYSGTENFFADDSLNRFLTFARTGATATHPILVINGDFVDFLRIVDVPSTVEEYEVWRQILASIGIEKAPDQLRASISSKERKFGLKTDDFKSVWKLHIAMQGHEALFGALAEWLSKNNPIVIVKGNHDLELYWLAVRNYLRLGLAQRIAQRTGLAVENVLKETVLPFVTFVDDALVIDGVIYVEHGHKYDKAATVVGGPTLGGNKGELNLPFGSFYNRYLFNRIELYYPFMDNIRPTPNVLHVLMRERFFLGLKVLLYFIPFTLRMIPKRYWNFMLKPVLSYALALGIPLLVVAVAWGGQLLRLFSQLSAGSQTSSGLLGMLEQTGIGFAKDSVALLGGYLLSRLVSYWQLTEPDSFLEQGKQLLQNHHGYQCVTMGHTHNPEQFELSGRWYINSSTWIPVVEASTAALREDRTYAVLHIEQNEQKNLIIHPLQRWNDDAGRLELLEIVERK